MRGILGRTRQAAETGRWGICPEHCRHRDTHSALTCRASPACTHWKPLVDFETLTWVQSIPQSSGPPSLIATSLCTDVTSGILICSLSDTNQSDVQMAEPRDPPKCRQAGDGAGKGHSTTSGTHVDPQRVSYPPVNLWNLLHPAGVLGESRATYAPHQPPTHLAGATVSLAAGPWAVSTRRHRRNSCAAAPGPPLSSSVVGGRPQKMDAQGAAGWLPAAHNCKR